MLGLRNESNQEHLEIWCASWQGGDGPGDTSAENNIIVKERGGTEEMLRKDGDQCVYGAEKWKATYYSGILCPGLI